MNEHLHQFEKKIIEYTNSRPSIIDQGILLWRIIHSMVLHYQEKHPDWKFVRHEDISLNPLEEYKKLFDFLGIAFTENEKKTIMDHSNLDDKNAESVTIRNSKENIHTWKKRLTPEKIEHIKVNVSDFAHYFYSESEW